MKDKDILELYESKYRPTGRTKYDLANDLGLTHGQIDHAMRRARQDEEDSSTELGTNHAVISAENTPQIKTLKDLLNYYELSLDDWDVVKVVANKWDVGRRNEKTNLVYEKGKQTGTVFDDGTIFTAPLLQIKAWLVRKEPVAVKPVVSPILFEFNNPRENPIIDVSNRVTALILPDVQIGFKRSLRTGQLEPFHDRLALSAALGLAEIFEPDRIVWLGDLFDLPDWSDKFTRSPEFWGIMQPAVYEAAWWLRRFRDTTLQMDVLEGNHDYRLKTSLYNHLQSAFDLRPVSSMGVVSESPSLSVPGLLSLNEMEVGWHEGYPDNQLWLSDYLVCEHGANSSAVPGGTARKLIENRDYSTIFGHIHRHEIVSDYTRVRGGRRVIYAGSPGTLCRIDGTVPGNTEQQNWNQGVMLVSYSEDSPEMQITHFPIHDGVLYMQGGEIRGTDFSDEIESAEGVGFFS